jgi:SAM-dependent methyltransferase
MPLRSQVPWHARIVAKLVLSRLPTSYAFWHRMNLFSHGQMDDPAYAYRTFRTHFDRSSFSNKAGGFVALELGPGDSLLSAVVTAAHGAAACHLNDAGAFATVDPRPYKAMAAYLQGLGLPAPDLAAVENLDQVLQRCAAVYGTRGLSSLKSIADQSVDFIWSQAVLEHVRRAEFLDTMRETHRVLRPGGVASHRVDLKDHLGGALNNLRLPSSLWEQEWMARSGFYTNRLRCSEILSMCREAGFEVELLGQDRWLQPPIRRNDLAAEFRQLSDDDLQVKGFDVLLRRA